MIEVIQGDMREVLARLAPAGVQFDACVTDPPYHIGFMGQGWDGGDVAFQPATWLAVYGALKPGAHLLAFGGSRTFHRIACAIEDAGFELRDTLMWLYGSGFPKSLNIGKQIDKLAGATRQVVSEGAPVKRMIPGADQNGTGSWIKDNGRVYVPRDTLAATPEAAAWEGWGTALKPAFEPIILARKPLAEDSVARNVLALGTGAINIDACKVPAGRWPANVLHDGSEEVLHAFAAYGDRGASAPVRGTEPSAASVGRVTGKRARVPGAFHADSGTAVRFFYCAKADAGDRADSKHPTIKPIELMRYLVRLVAPKGAHVLDPFAGSGTTGEAAMLEGCEATLVELRAEACDDIRHRIRRWSGQDSPLFNTQPAEAM